MLVKSNFFSNFSFDSKKFSNNLKKTKKTFVLLKSDIENFKIPLLESFKRDFPLSFSSQIIRKFSKYKNIVVIGMGGSILGTKCIYSFFKKKIKKKVFFFDNLDSKLHSEFRKIKNFKNSCFIIISKSGDTLETITNFSILYSKTKFKKNLIIITEMKDSSLMNIANKYGAEIVEHKDDIGGRYSVLTEVGMLPSALMKINVKKFKNLKRLINNKNFTSTLIQNVASIYTLNNIGVKNSVILNYSSNLNDLCFWYQQLIGESLGKKGKGITPITSRGPKDHHSLLQLYLDGPKDKFFTFFRSSEKNNKYKVPKNAHLNSLKFLNDKSLEFIIRSQSDAAKNIFKKKNIPFREFVFKKNNEEELGMIFTFFVLETIILARLMNVNPFDQPAVEQVKVETQKILSR